MNVKLKLILPMIIWGSMGIFTRYTDLPASVIALARGGFGLFFLGMIIHLKKIPVPADKLKQNGLLLTAGGIALGLDWIFLFESYKRTTIAAATLTYYTAPLFLIVFSRIFLKEKLSFSKLVSIFFILCGMLLVTGTGESFHADGIAFGLAAAIFYTLLTLLNRFTAGIPPVLSTAVQLGIGTATTLPYILITRDFLSLSPTFSDLFVLIILGVVHTGLAFFLYFASLPKLPAHTVALFSYIDPATALVLSVLILREPITPVQLLGTIFILGTLFPWSHLFKKINLQEQ